MLKPTDCIVGDFDSSWYQKWALKLRFPSARHAKFWEMAAIAEALDNRGMLSKGKSGLGMGVGHEQLVSLFASMGVEVTATDQDPNDAKAQKWDNGQLAKSAEALYYPEIIDRKNFRKKIHFEHYDMLVFNKKYKDKFDFIWHNCVIGHLGSLESAVKHLIESSEYIKEGGWLVFTTELNISSLDKTVDSNSDTVIWRLKDVDELIKKMVAIGMVADRFKLRLIKSDEDLDVNYNHDLTIYSAENSDILNDRNYVENKITFGNYVITQILLCFQKTKSPNAIKRKLYAADYIYNKNKILNLARKSSDISDYFNFDKYKDGCVKEQILPEFKTASVNIKGGQTKDVILRFKNNTLNNLYDHSFITPFSTMPVVLATDKPINRTSPFYDKSWFSNNRPSVEFYHSVDNIEANWNAHRAKIGDWFEYKFRIKAPKKNGVYTENFILIIEGVGEIKNSAVSLKVNVLK